MNKRKVISPETIEVKFKNLSILYKLFNYFYKPFFVVIKSYILQLMWRHNSYNKTFEWDWDEINFNRIAIVNLILKKYESPHYLEIGCASNTLFNSIPIKNKIGVDPSSGGNMRMTSDDFFDSNTAKFDVVFIDGLHTYEQVRRDVINSLNNIKNGGWILLHDMLPRNWLEHHVPIVTFRAWTGDVWKVAFELIETKGIEFKILKADYGVGIIKVIDSQITLHNLTEELLHKEFNFFYENLYKLPIIDWIEVEDWVGN